MKKNLKVFVSLLALTLVLGIQTTARAAEETTPAFAITEEAVIIDHVPYAIENGAIQYEGKTYEVQEDDTLISYDKDGLAELLVLPINVKEVTEPEKIAELNAALSQAQRNNFFSRFFRSTLTRNISAIDLPYSENVVKGALIAVTPVFNVISTEYHYATHLKVYGLSLLDDPNFKVAYYIRSSDNDGPWKRWKQATKISAL